MFDTLMILKILNLPAEDKIINLVNLHKQSIEEQFKSYFLNDKLIEVTAEEGTGKHELFKVAFCLYLLSNIVEFLNLKTLGEGIITTTGMDSRSTTLLVGNEIVALQKRLEIKALSTTRSFLNNVGLERLKELHGTSNNNKGCRVTII